MYYFLTTLSLTNYHLNKTNHIIVTFILLITNQFLSIKRYSYIFVSLLLPFISLRGVSTASYSLLKILQINRTSTF